MYDADEIVRQIELAIRNGAFRIIAMELVKGETMTTSVDLKCGISVTLYKKDEMLEDIRSTCGAH